MKFTREVVKAFPMIKKCTQCGVNLNCGGDSGDCWCFKLPKILNIEGKDCFCKKCLTEKIKNEKNKL